VLLRPACLGSNMCGVFSCLFLGDTLCAIILSIFNIKIVPSSTISRKRKNMLRIVPGVD